MQVNHISRGLSFYFLYLLLLSAALLPAYSQNSTVRSPLNGATGVQQPINFVWDAVSTDSVSYTLQLFNSETAVTPIITHSGITTTHYTLESIQPGTRYWWRTVAFVTGGNETVSSKFSFTTAALSDLSAPTLLYPAHQSTGVVLEPLLRWNAVTNATSYTVQYARNSAMTEGLVTRENITATQLQLSALLANTSYAWRVRAQNGTAVSTWSTIWYFTTKAPDALAAPVLLSPAHQSTGIVLEPLLRWYAVTNATSYTVQYARNSAMTEGLVTRENITATQLQLSALLANTPYAWRVRAQNGTVISPWSAIWYFTTKAPDSLAAPVLISPENQSTGVVIEPLLRWNAVSNATSYTVQYARNTAMNEGLVTRENLTATQVQLSALLANTIYLWRVRAQNGTLVSPWSTIWIFTTKPASSSLAAPILLSPGNQSTGIVIEPLLRWNAVTNATSYTVQYARNSTMTEGLVTRENLTATQVQISALLANTTYAWRVRAQNGTLVSPWSTIWIFTTKTATSSLAAPVLLSPANQSTGVGLDSALLYWNFVNGATSYTIQYARNSAMTEGLVTLENITSSPFRLTALLANTTYAWRVRAQNGTTISPWSTIWIFTTKAATVTLAAPVLLSPALQSTGVVLEPLLKWNPVTNATSYTVQYARNTAFTEGLVTRENLSATQVQVSALLANTTYVWRVRAQNGTSVSAWSTVWYFTTKANTTTLAAPILNAPANQSIGVSLDALLYWNKVDSATSYTVQIARNSAMTEGLVTSENLTAITLRLPALLANTTYAWRVRAQNGTTVSPWSTIWIFTTKAATVTLAAPVLLSPALQSTGVVLEPLLKWNPVTNATSYTVQYARNTAFTEGLVTRENLSATQVQVSALLANTTYTWRVRAQNGTNIGPWSTIWVFTTKAATGTLAAPLLLSPANQSTGIGLDPFLYWKIVSGAKTYTLQYARNTYFTEGLVTRENITANYLQLSGLLAGTKYFWRVRAQNNDNIGVWSTIWFFYTRA